MALTSRVSLCVCLVVAVLSPALPGEEVAEQSSSICDDGKVSWDEETAATHTTSLVHLSIRASCSCSLFSECCCFSAQYMSEEDVDGPESWECPGQPFQITAVSCL